MTELEVIDNLSIKDWKLVINSSGVSWEKKYELSREWNIFTARANNYHKFYEIHLSDKDIILANDDYKGMEDWDIDHSVKEILLKIIPLWVVLYFADCINADSKFES